MAKIVLKKDKKTGNVFVYDFQSRKFRFVDYRKGLVVEATLDEVTNFVIKSGKNKSSSTYNQEELKAIAFLLKEGNYSTGR